MSFASGQGTPEMQSFLPASQKDFTFNVFKAFLEDDILFCKLQHASIKFRDNIALLNRFAEAMLIN